MLAAIKPLNKIPLSASFFLLNWQFYLKNNARQISKLLAVVIIVFGCRALIFRNYRFGDIATKNCLVFNFSVRPKETDY